MAQQSNSSSDRVSNTPCDQKVDSLLPTGIMIRGLGRLQQLLQYQPSNSHAKPTILPDNTASVSWEKSPAIDVRSRPSKRSRASHSSKSQDSPGFSQPPPTETANTWTNPSSSSIRNSSNCFGEPTAALHMHGTRQLAHALDLPTRLLFVACYINFIRLCRCVFANICYCLVSFDNRFIFTRLSKLFTRGVSLALDGHIQIYVLIKVVSRMLEGIRVSLGPSQEYRILGGSVQEEKNGNNLPEKGATPK